MFKVYFDSILIFNASNIEDAVAYALGLHRSSNVPHSIGVYDCESDSVSICFTSRKVEDDVRS